MKTIFKIIRILIGIFLILFSFAGVSHLLENGFSVIAFLLTVIPFVLGVLLVTSSIKNVINKSIEEAPKAIESSGEITVKPATTERIDFSKKNERNRVKAQNKKLYKKYNKQNRKSEIPAASFKDNEIFVNVVSNNSFGNWEPGIHDEKSQKNRINRAINELPPPLMLDINAKEAEFVGSNGELYKTSLNSCECMDFAKRKLPCKHIYRLAIELGVFKADSSINKNLFKNKKLLKEHVNSLSFSSRIVLRELSYLSIYRDIHGKFFAKSSFPYELIKKGFCIEIKENISEYVVPELRADLIKLLYDFNFINPPKERAITRTIKSYMNNLDEDNIEIYKNNIILVGLSTNAKEVVRSIFSYLN